MKVVRFLLAFSLLACVSTARGQAPAGKVVGIMPVFDISGDAFGQQFAQNLTAMLYERLENAPFRVVLMNPGGLYTPLIPDSLPDYAQSIGVDTVLVTTLQQTDKPQKGDYILHVEAKFVDAQTMKESTPSNYTAKVSHNDALLDAAKKGVDFGNSTNNTMRQGSNLYSAMAMSNGSRPFYKQPLGKAAMGIADAIQAQVLAQGPKGGSPLSVKGGTCTYSIRVGYTAKKAFSRAYDIIVNGLNQSLYTKDGVTTLENQKSGPVFLQVSVADPPYRMPTQDLYQANTVLDCSQPERQLFLDLDATGAALIHWK